MQRRWIALIMAGLLLWGAYHAVGAYQMNQNIWRPVVVMGFSLAFVGFWLLLLRSRSARLARDKQQSSRSEG